MRLKKQKGFALVTLIVAIVMMAALGVGIYAINTSSTFSELLATRDYNAYQLAKSGMRYAVFNSTSSPEGNYCMSGNQCFTITRTVVAGVINFKSTGNVNAGSFLAASRLLAYTMSSIIASVSFAEDMKGFTDPNISNPGADPENQAIYVDEANKIVYGGGNVTDSSGTLVYKGTKSFANCVDGACDFGLGIRAYFEFTFIHEDNTVNYTKCADENGTCSFSGTTTVRYGKREWSLWYGWREYWTYRDNVTASIACNNATFGDPFSGITKECQYVSSPDSQANADGFTFFVMSAITNTNERSGGQATGGTSIGELIGYAGPGNSNSGCSGTNCALVKDGLGLKPPKMALELDTWPNPGTGNICASGSRGDPAGNHAAIIFWGEGSPSGSGCVGSSNSYDDNKHGVGTPLNSTNSGASILGYYGGGLTTCKTSTLPNRCNYMEDGYKYHVRIEIVRPAVATGGVYNYSMVAWIVRNDYFVSNPASLTVFKDLLSSLPVSVSYTVRRDFTLTAQQHEDFKKMYFGYTEGTGGTAQLVKWEALNVFFPLAALGCSYSIAPMNYTATSAGVAGQTVAVTPTNGACPWTAVSNNGWITVTAGSEGAGSGTVTYNVAANTTGSARTGTMTIATRTFTVTQEAPAFYCIGGTETTSGGTKIHTFTTSGSLVCTGSGSTEVLVVAGGGGAGFSGANALNNGGGGGAGGLVYTGNHVLSDATYPVTVGNGGAAATTQAVKGSNGQDSSFDGVTAIHGGGGGSRGSNAVGDSVRNGNSGGSGGGAGKYGSLSLFGAGGTGTVGQGSNGADSSVGNTGGGGGAGGSGSGNTGGLGQIIFGYTLSKGGDAESNSAAGAANSGNGGNASPANSNAVGGAGGSGIVIIRY